MSENLNLEALDEAPRQLLIHVSKVKENVASTDYPCRGGL